MVIVDEKFIVNVGKAGSNLLWADRIDFSKLSEDIINNYIHLGVPLVVENCTAGIERENYSWKWFKENHGEIQLINTPRDNDNFQDLFGWKVKDYINYFEQEPASRNPKNLYGKDMPCPKEWEKGMEEIFGKYKLHYHSPNDVMNDLPLDLQPQTLLKERYVGFEGNFTGAHIDICGTLGHNLMTYAEPQAYAFWFVVASKDLDKAVKFWQQNGEDKKYTLFTDNWFLRPEILKTANFNFYVIKQKEGDFVFLPPNVPHQVVNMGGRSIKVSWNRQTATTLESSLFHCLSLYRARRKPEIYRLKATAYCALGKRIKIANQLISNPDSNVQEMEYVLNEFPPLLRIVNDIVRDEKIENNNNNNNNNNNIKCFTFKESTPHSRVCNLCHCDIFNRCFHCQICGITENEKIKEREGDYDACLECVAIGRGCRHTIEEPKMKFYQSIPHETVEQMLTEAIAAYKALSNKVGKDLESQEILKFQTIDKQPNEISIASAACEKIQLEKLSQICYECKQKEDISKLVKCGVLDCKQKYCMNCLKKWLSFRKVMSNLRTRDWVCPECIKKQKENERKNNNNNKTDNNNKRILPTPSSSSLGSLPKIPKKVKTSSKKEK